MAENTDSAGKDIGLEETVALLAGAKKLLVLSHRRPDGDCIGSTVGLLLGLRQLGKDARAYNMGPFLDRWHWLKGGEMVEGEFPDFTPDLTVFVDCGSSGRVADGFKATGPTLNIDHHLTNTKFADANFIDSNACAVGEQIFDILRELGATVTPEIAAALYVSVMTDTGCFRYSNTTAQAFAVAGSLVAHGAQPGTLSQQIYENRSRGEILLTGKVYSQLQFECDGQVAWAELMLSDYEGLGSAEDEPEGLSSEIRGISGVEVSVLFHELEEGGLRASFRGKGKVDCSAIAGAFGGGGHFNAAGMSLPGTDYAESRNKVIEEVRRVVAAS